MIIVDHAGNEQDQLWLVENFGPLTVQHPTNPAFNLVTLTERADSPRPEHAHIDSAAAIIVQVLKRDGSPYPDVPVCWSWPDAPPIDKQAGWLPRGVIGYTNTNGHVGFPMGKGAYYSPPTKGPHQVWIYGEQSSPFVDGLGMIAGTNHTHLDVTFQIPSTPPVEPPPSPPPSDPTLTLLQDIRRLLLDIDAQLLAAIAHLQETT